MGQQIYLIKDKEAYIVAKSEIEGAHGLPMDTTSISIELQQVLHGVGRRHANNGIKANSVLRYARRVIVCANREEENSGGQKRKTMTGTINVSGLSHKRGGGGYPRLAW